MQILVVQLRCGIVEKQHGAIDCAFGKLLEIGTAGVLLRHVEEPLVEQVVEQPPAIDRRAEAF